MPHCLSHWPPWVTMLACSLSSPVEQRFSHFPPNPYKMSPRERHLSWSLKTMKWAPGRVRNTSYLRGQRMNHISTLWNIVLMDFSSFPVTSRVTSGSGSSESLCPWLQSTCSWHGVPCSSTHQSLLPGTWKALPVGSTCHQVLGEVSPSSPTLVSNLLCSTWATPLICISSIIRVRFLTLRKCSMDKWVARDSQNCSTVYADIMPSMTMSP